MENIKKIIILISLITMCAVIISIIDLNKKVNNLQNNLIENKEKNQAEVNVSAELPNLTVQDEENLEEQEVEDEGFELQGEIAYEGGKSRSWNLNISGEPKLTYISQIDNRWKNYPYTVTNNKSQTIGKSGCGVATAAMIIDSIVGNVSVTELADVFVKYGYRSPNNGTYWSANRAIADEFNIEYQETSNYSVILEKLKNNNYIIASVGNGLFTTGGHYIMIYGVDGNNLKIYDSFLYKGKFDTSTRRGKAYVDGDTVICSTTNFKNYANYKRFFCYKYNRTDNSNENKSEMTSYTRYVRVSSRLNIRSGAGIENKIVGKLNNNERVTVYETKGNWSRIGENKWVSSDYLAEKSVNVNRNTIGQYKRLKNRTYLYSKSNLTGKKYTYLAKTQVKIIRNVSSNIDYVYVVKTGRYAYIRTNAYK